MTTKPTEHYLITALKEGHKYNPNYSTKEFRERSFCTVRHTWDDAVEAAEDTHAFKNPGSYEVVMPRFNKSGAIEIATNTYNNRLSIIEFNNWRRGKYSFFYNLTKQEWVGTRVNVWDYRAYEYCHPIIRYGAMFLFTIIGIRLFLWCRLEYYKAIRSILLKAKGTGLF